MYIRTYIHACIQYSTVRKYSTSRGPIARHSRGPITRPFQNRPGSRRIGLWTWHFPKKDSYNDVFYLLAAESEKDELSDLKTVMCIPSIDLRPQHDGLGTRS